MAAGQDMGEAIFLLFSRSAEEVDDEDATWELLGIAAWFGRQD